MSVWIDRIRNITERLTHSPRFVALSSVAQFVIDMVIWSLVAIASSYARFEYQGHHDPFNATKSSVFRVLPIVLIVHAIVGYVVGIYRRRWRYGSFDEVLGLIVTTAITTFILLVLRFFDHSLNPFPRSVIIIASVPGLCSVAGSRFFWRLIREQIRRPNALTATKILVYGAGEGGIQMVNTLMRNPFSPYLPVGFLDDNPDTHRLSISGVAVLGGREQLAQARTRTGATTLLIAIPSADSALILLANVALGLSQGFTWSTTVIMKIDIVGLKHRGTAMGLNESAGYVAVGASSAYAAYYAETSGLIAPILYVAMGIVLLASLLAVSCKVADTSESYFSFNEAVLKAQYTSKESVKLEIIDSSNKKIDSIVYSVNNMKILSSFSKD